MHKLYRSAGFLRTSLAAGILVFVVVSAAMYLRASALPDCPVEVRGPETAYEGDPIVFQASPNNYDSYSWAVSTGDISGPSNTPSITVVNVAAGSSCKATVTVRQDNCRNSNSKTTSVVTRPACPTLQMSCPEEVEEGELITFTANLSGADPNVTFNWTVSAGEITNGQGTATITVKTTGLAGQSITATVILGGVSPDCSDRAPCTTKVKARERQQKLDQHPPRKR